VYAFDFRQKQKSCRLTAFFALFFRSQKGFAALIVKQ